MHIRNNSFRIVIFFGITYMATSHGSDLLSRFLSQHDTMPCPSVQNTQTIWTQAPRSNNNGFFTVLNCQAKKSQSDMNTLCGTAPLSSPHVSSSTQSNIPQATSFSTDNRTNSNSGSTLSAKLPTSVSEHNVIVLSPVQKAEQRAQQLYNEMKDLLGTIYSYPEDIEERDGKLLALFLQADEVHRLWIEFPKSKICSEIFYQIRDDEDFKRNSHNVRITINRGTFRLPNDAAKISKIRRRFLTYKPKKKALSKTSQRAATLKQLGQTKKKSTQLILPNKRISSILHKTDNEILIEKSLKSGSMRKALNLIARASEDLNDTDHHKQIIID